MNRLDYRQTSSKLVEFDFNDDPVSGSAIVARRAVLWPLSAAFGTEFPNPTLAARLVLLQWRDLVKRLAEAGFDKLTKFTQQTLCGNCFPSTVCSPTRPLTFVCRYAFCPWCHSRKVERLAEKLGFDDSERFHRLLDQRQAFIAVYNSSIGLDACRHLLSDHLQHEAASCRALVRANRETLHAAYWQVTPVPSKFPTGELSVEVQTRFLGIKEPDKRILLHPANWVFWDVQQNTEEKLSAAVSCAAGYPVELMTGATSAARIALEARDGKRLSEFSGAFYGAPENETAAAVDGPV